MKHYTNGFVGNRVLKLNVGFLLGVGAGNSHVTEFDVPAVRVSDDVDLAYIRGPLRLSRTKEGVLVQGELHLGVEGECYRCLTPVHRDVVVNVEELYYTQPNRGGFSLDDDGILDLAPLLREEAIIEDERGALCREDCQGLCMICGTNLNESSCDCDDDAVDPRLAKLKQLLDK